MKVTWLTQAGLLIETGGLLIMIDPYLSDCVGRLEGKHRRIPVDETLFDLCPDVMVFTHDHIDHYDPDTAPRFLEQKEKPMVVLSPHSCWQKARAFGAPHNYIRFEAGVEWTEKEVRFISVPAEHSDPCAVGVVIEAEGKRLYITGDTLYSSYVLNALPFDVNYVFLPINGAGNNMNAKDAARFAAEAGARYAIPLHYGLLDELTPDDFAFENKILLTPYQTTDI